MVELEAYQDILASPADFLAYAELRGGRHSPKETLGQIEKHATSTSRELAKLDARISAKRRALVRKYERADLGIGRRVPMSILDRSTGKLDSRALETLLSPSVIRQAQQQQQQACPILTVGAVRASAFRHINWLNSPASAFAFIPRSAPFTIPSRTFQGDWSGEVGAYFFAGVRRSAGFGTLVFTSELALGLFEFTLPAPECDSVVYWAASAVANGVNWSNWVLDADWGSISGQWVTMQSPTGLPIDLALPLILMGGAGEWNGQNLRKHVQAWLNPVRQSETVFDGSFTVRAGVQSRIFLGNSITLVGGRQRIGATIELNTWRRGGAGDYYEFPWGVFYVMTPQT